MLGLAGLAPATIRPTALTLNILVAALGTFHFARAGWFSWRLFWPFAVTSIPFAAVGGALALDDPVYRVVVGVALLLAAWRLLASARGSPEPGVRSPRALVALVAGAALGLLAGLTGVGGGIFLSPLILLAGWAGAKETAAVSAAFVLANSIAGLGAFLTSGGSMPTGTLPLLAAAGAGGWLGSRLGARRLRGPAIRRLLALVLAIAAAKFLWTA